MNNCLNCNKPVKNKYCDTSCQNKHLKRKPSKKSIEIRSLTIASKWKNFKVNCYYCNEIFDIKEFNVNIPKKEKYFCSQKCSCTYSSNVNKQERIEKLKFLIENQKM